MLPYWLQGIKKSANGLVYRWQPCSLQNRLKTGAVRAPDVDRQSLQIAWEYKSWKGWWRIQCGLVKQNFGSDSVYTGKRRAKPLHQRQHRLGIQIIIEYFPIRKYKVILSTLFCNPLIEQSPIWTLFFISPLAHSLRSRLVLSQVTCLLS